MLKCRPVLRLYQKIDIGRPRVNKTKEINKIKNELLKNNKKLLEGKL